MITFCDESRRALCNKIALRGVYFLFYSSVIGVLSKNGFSSREENGITVELFVGVLCCCAIYLGCYI